MAKGEELEEKRCAHLDEATGERCGGFHIQDSPYCHYHAGGMELMHQRRRQRIARRKELIEDLDYSHHDLQSKEGIAVFVEKVINGVLAGHLKRDRAGLIAMFLPLAWKAACELKGKNQSTLSLQLTETKKLNVKFQSPQELDAFLLANDQYAVQIAEGLQKDGRLKIEKRKEPAALEVKATEVMKPEELKIPAKEIAQISNKTDIPLKPAQVVDLFGACLGDALNGQGPEPVGVDCTGFGELFTKGDEAIPEGAGHRWQGFIESEKNGVGRRKFRCLYCEKVSDSYDPDGLCPKVPR